MPFRRFPLVVILLLGSALAFADNTQPSHMTKQTRQEIIRVFNAELCYVRTNFPMGKTGLKLRNGVLTPSGDDLQRLIALWGPAAKPGDQARITDVEIKGDFIHFEFNGGPIKKQKWYQRIEIQGAGGSTPVAPSDSNANARGSFVDVYFDKYVPDMTGPELKKVLRPVFDFDAKTPLEAYLETVPPKIKEAIKNHHVLVGMNREMVMYAKGRPPKKLREHADEVDYEEWIYGDPPQDVDFVRFVGEEVARVETMKVGGQKEIRTEREVDLPTTAAASNKPQERPVNAPTLRRPGEDMPDARPAGGIDSTRPIGPPPSTDPGGNKSPN
ncbi:MAG: hypothetical protein DMG80_13780 [Acidobacteria bacterium]|nr:MAG: hypothetical protein DMG80_13780 [Acidobacteriota bacterium]